MAFWMDPLLLIGAGLIVARIGKKWMYNSTSFIPTVSAVVLFLFYFVSVGMFCNLSIVEPAWKALGCGSGTEYMVNGFIFDFVSPGAPWTSLSSWAMFFCIIMFVLYPFWLWSGIALGRRAFGIYPWE